MLVEPIEQFNGIDLSNGYCYLEVESSSTGLVQRKSLNSSLGGVLVFKNSAFQRTNDVMQFRYVKIQPKTIDFNARLLGVNPANSVVIPMSLVPRSIVLG